jgi:hypothetical protein
MGQDVAVWWYNPVIAIKGVAYGDWRQNDEQLSDQHLYAPNQLLC